MFRGEDGGRQNPKGEGYKGERAGYPGKGWQNLKEEGESGRRGGVSGERNGKIQSNQIS